MSTTYAIFNKEMETDEYGNILEDYSNEDYVIIGLTHGFTTDGEIIANHLKDDTPVYATDNETKVKTIKDLKEYYDKDN